MALAAHIQPNGHLVATLLALARPANPPPAVVRAFVVVHQLLCHLRDPLSPLLGGHGARAVPVIEAVDDGAGPLDEPVLAPLGTGAGFPGRGADVAELGSAETGCDEVV